MNFTHNPFFMALAAVCALMLTACSDEFMHEDSSDEQYVRDFINKYGIPDSEHTWSMAKSVRASVDVAGLSQGSVEIFTGHPGSSGARLVARLPLAGGKAAGTVTLADDSDGVYLRVKDTDGIIRRVTQAAVSGSTLSTGINVGLVPGSRATVTAADLDLGAYVMAAMTRNYYYMFRDELGSAAERDAYTYAMAIDRFNNDDDYFYYPDPDNEWFKMTWLDANRHHTPVPGLKYLELKYEMGDPLSYLNELAPIFDRYSYTDKETGETMTGEGVFKEGVNNIDHYYHHITYGHKLDPDVTFTVKEEGSVPMQCIWRGTATDDYFGYYYYTPDGSGKAPSAEQLWHEIPKYVFLTPDDITKESSLTQRSVDNGSSWENLEGMGTAYCQTWTQHSIESLIRGRKYYLAYYGENYDQEPSYTFPKGVKIGYFLYSNKAQTIYFSDCRSQYELSRRTYKDGAEGPMMRPFAAKFRMSNRNYVGFGDESGDCDLNDVVFIAENVETDHPDITPPPLVEDDPSANAQTWTLACEDLGSTDDVDFNDIVLDVAYVAGDTHLTITPRAAGGTLVSNIYFREDYNSDHTFLGEIHELMTGTPGVLSMINTYQSFHQVDPKNVKGIKVSVPVDFDFAAEDNGFLSRIKITTRHKDDEEYNAKVIQAYINIAGAGKIPQMLLLSGEWHWPTERTSISDAYPKFVDWVKSRTNTDWVHSRLPYCSVSHRIPCSH